jgi:hypothetical protein
LQRPHPAASRADQLDEKKVELEAFKDAGVITQAELEEQMTKFHWNLA